MRKDNPLNLGLLWTDLALTFPIVNKDDHASFTRRYASEGINFLTKELPKLGKDLDRMLIGGEPLNVTARFRKRKGTNVPEFLHDIFLHVVYKDGTMRPNPSPSHIKLLRQLLLMYYKLETDYDKEVVKGFVSAFTELDSRISDDPLGQTNQEVTILNKARNILADLLIKEDPRFIRPCHGSGATACRTKNHDKYHSFRYIDRLNKVYPYEEYFFVNTAHFTDDFWKYWFSEDLSHPVSRLAAVPKDSRGPRLICMEPREMMYIQQGLMRWLYAHVEQHPLTAGWVNFTDQFINRNLAREASIHLEYATLDLKDASDRVRWDLVKAIFPPRWVDALEACRTEYVELPNGEVYGPLNKFASMGSAVCFPIEALTFWALIKGGLNIDVYVYGDDLIVPTTAVEAVMSTLELFSLRVNADKSCYKTRFRESCGGDYYGGQDVGYVKVRHEVQRNVNSHLAAVDFCNEIIYHFGEKAALRLMARVDDYYGPHVRTLAQIPLSYRCCSGASNIAFFRRRWNKHLQKYEFNIPIVKTRTLSPRKDPQHHWCELLRKLLKGDVRSRRLTETNLTEGQCAVGEYAEGHSTIKRTWRGDL